MRQKNQFKFDNLLVPGCASHGSEHCVAWPLVDSKKHTLLPARLRLALRHLVPVPRSGHMPRRLNVCDERTNDMSACCLCGAVASLRVLYFICQFCVRFVYVSTQKACSARMDLIFAFPSVRVSATPRLSTSVETLDLVHPC